MGEKYITKKEYSTSNGQIRQFRIRIIMLKWHKTITVQAQRDYIGGNNVATNISQIPR